MKEMRFFYVPDAVNLTELPMDEAMHALRVLRLKSGDEMFLMDGEGNFYNAVVTIAATKRCMYEIKEKIPQVKGWRGNIHIAMAPTKMMDRIEWLCEKATEIGFDEISFLNCKFSERKVMRTVRLEKIIVSAVKQSHKPWKPKINTMVSFKDFIKTPIKGRKFIAHCYEEIERKDFYKLISPLAQSEEGENITVLIGPEGDFSLDEVNMAIENGYESITLGSSRLRTETAALSATMMSQLVLRNDTV
ncbi:MAG: 16S rRNA (uracil(1498)-N(3))-methyltransferase [Prevotellaceae bacterium]|nr:16S rRNA (uracil(1498)-N(3))-methyltransferase [Prevotellaceae bacterium]